MSKIKLKKRKKYKKLNFIIIIIITVIIGIFYTFRYINKKVLPVLIDYAESEANKIATTVINHAINNEVTNNLNTDDLFITTEDNNNNIKSIDYNPIYVNKILSLITNSVQDSLIKLQEGDISELGISSSIYYFNEKKLKNGVIFEVPTGVAFNNILLSNLGPKIPVKLNMIGDLSTNINTAVTEYGINNALVQINVNVKVVEQLILPYISKKMTIETNIPIAIKLLQGEIPSYYFNGLSSPNLTVPIE